MTKNLMIVESPAKAKTIENFLGDGFTVKSCYGHIRDLPKNDSGVDIENNYTPQYVVTPEKVDIVNELKKLAKNADVWLATDEDREGEAISWHICMALGLDVKKTKRIVFHEITKPAIQKAVSNPRTINIDLVDAQQARRVLDRLVGFELSPVLWQKISRSNSLSAGRVQSVSVRLVVEREREIRNSIITPFFKVSAIFTSTDDNGKTHTLKAELSRKLNTLDDANEFLNSCIPATYKIKEIQVKPAKRSPQPPFTTSTLQQEASRKLGFSVSRTMIVAQKLYENGHITYMRTDSTNLSDTALNAASQEINEKFGPKYAQTRQYKTKSASAQEAHEAIRPTYFNQPEAGNNPEEQKLYKLIWKRTVASQMSDAQLERTTINIEINTKPQEELLAKGEVVLFDGFLKLYDESNDEETDDNNTALLPPLKVGQSLNLKTMKAEERFNRPPARYNEASLVKKLEELGIGRPSTYAPTINTIQQRNYVVKEDREGTIRPYQVLTLYGKEQENALKIIKTTEKENIGAEKAKLFPTDIGMLVTDFLTTNFKNVLDYSFTADIEKKFDEIANGSIIWTKMLDDFYKPFHLNIEQAKKNADRITGERSLGNDPKTGKPVVARMGKFGPLVAIGNIDDPNDTLQFSTIRPPFTLETITLEQALECFKLPRVVGEYENAQMKVNDGRFGPYILHNNAFYSLPKNTDLFAISSSECIDVIEAKREAERNKIIKTFENQNIQILNGRWGPYIKHQEENIKIPKNKNAAELTLQDCLELINNNTAKPTKKKAAPKKTVKAKANTAKTSPKSAKPKK